MNSRAVFHEANHWRTAFACHWGNYVEHLDEEVALYNSSTTPLENSDIVDN